MVYCHAVALYMLTTKVLVSQNRSHLERVTLLCSSRVSDSTKEEIVVPTLDLRMRRPEVIKESNYQLVRLTAQIRTACKCQRPSQGHLDVDGPLTYAQACTRHLQSRNQT